MKELVVVGAGVAGLSAALYAGRLGIGTTVVDELGGGGQLLNAGPIDTYPGLTDNPLGADFVGRLTEQVFGFDVEIELTTVSRIASTGGALMVECEDQSLQARAVILATGTRYRRLGLASEESLTGRGISDCAICDGGFFAGDRVMVVGGGDRAAEGALHLSQNNSKIELIHPDAELRCVDYLRRKVQSDPGITVHPQTTVEEIVGDERVEAVVVRTAGESRTFDVRGVFVNIGVEPRSEAVAGLAEVDDSGRVVVDLGMRTNVPGLFAAGAVRSGTADQLVTAVGDGVTAAISVGRYLREGLA
jgi:thioredoxin reductase (NADPH)